MDGCVAMTDTILTVTCEGNVSCTDLPYQPGATIVSPIILSLSGVVGQIWALYYLYTSTRPQHSRTVFFLLLSTLIWTDLAGKIITTTPALVAYLHHTWAGGVPMCNLHGFSMMLVSLVTHLLVSTMAVERFLGIRHGYFYNKNITTSRTKLVLLCMWVFSVVFCALPLFGVGQYALQYPGSWCYVNIHVTAADPLLHRLYTNLFGAFTLLSLLVMVTCNVVVITTLLCLRLCRGGCCNHSRCAPHRSSRQRELEMQMVVVLVVITVVFVLSWTPIDVRLFVNQVWPHTTREDHYQDLVAVRLTSFNQIVDPWVYIICRKVFMMRTWRWLRVSFFGSRLVAGRGNSNLHTPSHTKLAPDTKLAFNTKVALPLPTRPSFKMIRYQMPLKGEDDLGNIGRRGVPVVIELGVGDEGVDELATPPPSPPRSKDTLTRVLQAKEVVEIFTDSGTASKNTPTSHCGDSGPTKTHKHYLGGGRATPASPVVLCRRHSWGCVQDASTAKRYRTQSTQTFTDRGRPPTTDACGNHYHNHDYSQQHTTEDNSRSHDHQRNQGAPRHLQEHSVSYYTRLPEFCPDPYLDVYTNDEDDSVFIMTSDFTPLKTVPSDLTNKTNGVFTFISHPGAVKNTEPQDLC